ncbi:MAG: hypothetical protein ACYTBY_00430 [Planctomycetota bacterium]
MGCKKNNTQSINNELVIFHAGSLSVPFREISAEFNKQYPEIEPLEAGLRLEKYVILKENVTLWHRLIIEW